MIAQKVIELHKHGLATSDIASQLGITANKAYEIIEKEKIWGILKK